MTQKQRDNRTFAEIFEQACRDNAETARRHKEIMGLIEKAGEGLGCIPKKIS